jgi:hypothetical protein
MVLESSEAEQPKIVNGREMVWTSHANAKAVEEIRFYEGKIFGRNVSIEIVEST